MGYKCVFIWLTPIIPPPRAWIIGKIKGCMNHICSLVSVNNSLGMIMNSEVYKGDKENLDQGRGSNHSQYKLGVHRGEKD